MRACVRAEERFFMLPVFQVLLFTPLSLSLLQKQEAFLSASPAGTAAVNYPRLSLSSLSLFLSKAS